jgi:hypothetical protein
MRGKDATGDIAAADDQEPPLWRFLLFFHCAILPELGSLQRSLQWLSRSAFEPGAAPFCKPRPTRRFSKQHLRQGLILPYGCRNGFCGSLPRKDPLGRRLIKAAAPDACVLSKEDRACRLRALLLRKGEEVICDIESARSCVRLSDHAGQAPCRRVCRK